MAAVLSISTAFATTVYCKVTQSWWTKDGAAVGVYYWGGASAGTTWPGVRMTPVSGAEGTWTYDVPEDVTGLIFTRVNGSGDIADWGAKTADLSLPTDAKNLYTITSESAVWGNPGATGVWSVYAGEGSEEEMDTVYTWYGKRGDASATEAIEKGGTAAAYGGNSNIVVGAAQKTNWTIKLNKGFTNANFVGITLDKALEAGDKLQVAAFRTSASDAVFGIDFSEDAEQAATTCQILFPNNLQQISSNVAPEDTTFTVPDCAVGAKFIRIYRNSGSTGIYVANFTVLREKGGDTPEPPVAAKFYVTGDSALVTDAGFAGKAWNPDAIKAEADTLVLNLKAEQVYKLKVSLDGTWSTAKGFNELTEKPEGVTTDNDGNIIFSLAEAGAVQVIYIAGETPIFKIAGNFYVEPVPPTPNYYIIGAGEAFGEWSFVPVMQDTFKLSNLAAGDYMFRVALENGNWENTKGYSDLTEKTEGLSANNDNNILFTLAEAGDVAVVYNDSVFRVIGNFYVDPTPVVPTAAVTGDMTEWGEPIPFELSEDSTFATLYNDNIKKGTYAFKMIINGDWRSNGYEFHRGFPGCAGITGNTDANMTVVIDVEGAYTFKWYFANDSLAIIYPEKPEPVLADGFYLVGKFGGVDAWDPVAANLFAANPDTEGEYQLSIDLAVDDEIKVVYVAEDEITTWYPKEGNYIVDDHHNGPTTMYFRPEYNSDWSAFGGYFYLVPTSTVGFENTAADAKAVKVLKIGILVIEKNNKTYNVMGQMVK